MKLRRMVSFLGVLCVLFLSYMGSYIPGILFAGRQRRLFSEHGTMGAEMSVLPWEEEQSESDGAAENSLGTEQIEQTLRIWQESRGEILHEPVEGQLSMEEAFAAGQEWISSMMGAGCLPSDYTGPGQRGGDGDYVSAVLSTAAGKEGEGQPGESYYSFWWIRFYDENESLGLRINAVTGKVWEAELILYEREWNPPENPAYESLLRFLELSGVDIPAGGYAEREDGAVLYLADTMIYAQMEREDGEWIYVWAEDDGTKQGRRCVRISFRLGVVG